MRGRERENELEIGGEREVEKGKHISLLDGGIIQIS